MAKIHFKTALEVIKRSNSCCEACGRMGDYPFHHIFFKSQYGGKDRDVSWNLANVCLRCHRIIHHASTELEIKEKRIIDYKLKEQAISRYFGGRRIELCQILYRAKYKLLH